MNITEFFPTIYKKNPKAAVANLSDDEFIAKMGWRRVFHEGVGDGIHSPGEGVVAVFDEDDLDTYSDYTFYRYDPDAWVPMSDVMDGRRNGDGFEVEPLP